MANVAHSTLTGAELHEPKGVASALAGTVYVANGAGSGAWTDVGTSSFTGMIADFVTPVAPNGWLELDGTVISTSTYAGLYGVMAIQSSGTRTNGNAVVTSIPSTTQFRVGYYVFGTGIAAGTTILSVDSPTQITLSNNASSSGTSSFAVSPWLMDTGTIKLPDVYAGSRYRRSRSGTNHIGNLQADQNQSHTHTLSVSGTTSSDGAHTHTINITDPGHQHTERGDTTGGGAPNRLVTAAGNADGAANGGLTVSAVTNITAASVSAGAHTHTVTSTGTSGSNGGTEARPISLVVLTCVKT